jgi:hypothetical protein
VAGNQKFPIRDKQQSKGLFSSHAGLLPRQRRRAVTVGHDRTRRGQKLGRATKGSQDMQLDMQTKVLLGRAGDRVYSNLCTEQGS